MRAVSLFSGIGLMDLGLQQAGFEIVSQTEIDPYARAVLEALRVRSIQEAEDVRCDEVLRALLNAARTQALQRDAGEQQRFPSKEVLRSAVLRHEQAKNGANQERALQARRKTPKAVVRELRDKFIAGPAPHRSQPVKQPAIERDDALLVLSHVLALAAREDGSASRQEAGTPRSLTFEEAAERKRALGELRSHRLRGIGNGVLPQIVEFIGRRIRLADELFGGTT